MTDQESHAAPDLIKSLNDGGGVLGAIIGSAASLAINRLVGAVVDVPASIVDGFAQGIKDDNNARSLIRNQLASKVAERYASDPDQVERAAIRLLGKSVKKQRRVEAVAEQAVLLLTNDPPQAESTGPSEEFMDNFEELAENASTADLQNWFAKILAGECRKSGSYSKATLNVMRDMDSELALELKKIKKLQMFDDAILAIEWERGIKSDLLHSISNLAGLGLIDSSDKIKMMRCIGNQPFNVIIAGFVLVLKTQTDKEVNIGCNLLSKSGKEILTLIDSEIDREFAVATGKLLLGANLFDEAFLGELVKRPNGELGYQSERLLRL